MLNNIEVHSISFIIDLGTETSWLLRHFHVHQGSLMDILLSSFFSTTVSLLLMVKIAALPPAIESTCQPSERWMRQGMSGNLFDHVYEKANMLQFTYHEQNLVTKPQLAERKSGKCDLYTAICPGKNSGSFTR